MDSLPDVFIEVENAPRPISCEIRISGKDPPMTLPGTEGICMPPTPQGYALLSWTNTCTTTSRWITAQ